MGAESSVPTATARTITVTVNEQPVTFTEHQVTGAQIKSSAIAQGVHIQPDFTLFEVKPNGLQAIGDNDRVKLHLHQSFRAVAPDDNS